MTLRPVKALIRSNGLKPNVPATKPPRFQSVVPSELLIDGTYQRNLSERSVALIRKIVADWDWRRFKPPIVVRVDNGFHVIDGQHTSIAAATHGGIGKIPVMVVDADSVMDRARAFIGHNRDRITMTTMQMFYAAGAAGDEDVQTVQAACKRAGVSILRVPPCYGIFKPRETIAVSTLLSLVKRRSAIQARQVIETVANSNMAPLSAAALKAVEHLLFSKEFAGEFTSADLTSTMIKLGPELNRKAGAMAASKQIPHWRAWIAILSHHTTRARRGSAS